MEQLQTPQYCKVLADACTPNRVVSFISLVLLVEYHMLSYHRLVSFLKTLEGKHDISIMAARGFTIKDQLDELGMELNISPLLVGHASYHQKTQKRMFNCVFYGSMWSVPSVKSKLL